MPWPLFGLLNFAADKCYTYFLVRGTYPPCANSVLVGYIRTLESCLLLWGQIYGCRIIGLILLYLPKCSELEGRDLSLSPSSWSPRQASAMGTAWTSLSWHDFSSLQGGNPSPPTLVLSLFRGKAWYVPSFSSPPWNIMWLLYTINPKKSTKKRKKIQIWNIYYLCL